MMRKIRYMGNEMKYSAMSFLSLMVVLFLHFIHYLSAPLLMGAAAEMHTHQHGSMGSGSVLMSLLMLVLFAINLISLYFAVRQLVLAWTKRGNFTHHTYLCSAVSLVVICIGIYTIISLY